MVFLNNQIPLSSKLLGTCPPFGIPVSSSQESLTPATVALPRESFWFFPSLTPSEAVPPPLITQATSPLEEDGFTICPRTSRRDPDHIDGPHFSTINTLSTAGEVFEIRNKPSEAEKRDVPGYALSRGAHL